MSVLTYKEMPLYISVQCLIVIYGLVVNGNSFTCPMFRQNTVLFHCSYQYLVDFIYVVQVGIVVVSAVVIYDNFC